MKTTTGRAKRRAKRRAKGTYSLEPGQISGLRYWARVDGRGISEIFREAMHGWFREREAQAVREFEELEPGEEWGSRATAH